MAVNKLQEFWRIRNTTKKNYCRFKRSKSIYQADSKKSRIIKNFFLNQISGICICYGTQLINICKPSFRHIPYKDSQIHEEIGLQQSDYTMEYLKSAPNQSDIRIIFKSIGRKHNFKKGMVPLVKWEFHFDPQIHRKRSP